jgi:ubiquinol-cytochrome c reductase iron-sulfur subunit
MNMLQLSNPSEQDEQRRKWVLMTGALAGVAAVATAVPFASSFAPSERARAMGASVEVDIAGMAPGSIMTVEWRGKPVWILRRTADMLAGLAARDDQLADPESQREQQPAYARNPHRSIQAEFLVLVGICTHLGCSPNSVPKGSANPSVGEGWGGGFFCPCHGSTFDLAGRVFKNKPAPTNLEVPPYQFLTANRLLIGAHGLA